MSSQRSFAIRQDEIPPLLREALRQLGKARATAYSHETLVDEDACVFLYDCSGFVDYALERVAPEARDALPHTPGKRPLAKDFFEFLQKLASGGKKSRAWVAVLRTTDLIPGDVVAWLEPKGAQSTNTGHVTVVAERPRRRRQENGAEEFLLRVIDSTESPHALDTRIEGANGLGSGEAGPNLCGSPMPMGRPRLRRTSNHRMSSEWRDESRGTDGLESIFFH
jgi:hypothetical protein